MICPYCNKSETVVQKWTQSYDDERQEPTGGENITQTVYEPMECQTENCGAYHNGKCCFNNA